MDAFKLIAVKANAKFIQSEVDEAKYYPDLGSDTSSVWNFCGRSSEVRSRGNLKCLLFSQTIQLSVNKLQDAA